MGVLMSQTLSEIHFHNSIEVNAQIKFSKHLEHILEIFIENNEYFPPTHFSIVKDRLFKKIDQKIIYENGMAVFFLWYTVYPLFILYYSIKHMI